MQTDKSIYGIIGNPLAHSLSPILHNTAFKALEVDAEYIKFPLEPHELDGFFEQLKEETSPIFGLNVTVPYKQDVIPYLDVLTPLATRINAVNTIHIQKDRKLVGINTDAPGFMAHLQELNIDVADKRIAILGAGGSTRAILAALCLIPERPQSICIYNRTTSKTEDLIKDLGQRMNLDIVRPAHDITDLGIETSDILINTTSVGLKEDDPCLVDPELFHSGLFVYDLIYNPAQTELLQMAEERGARVANGLGMLYYQAVLALQHWAEMEIDEEIKVLMREALENEMK